MPCLPPAGRETPHICPSSAGRVDSLGGHRNWVSRGTEAPEPRHRSPGRHLQLHPLHGFPLHWPTWQIVHIQGSQRRKLAEQYACSFIPRPPSRGSPSHKSLPREKLWGLGPPERERVLSQASQDLGFSGAKRPPWLETQVLTPTCSVTEANCQPSPGLRCSICKVSTETPHPPESGRPAHTAS